MKRIGENEGECAGKAEIQKDRQSWQLVNEACKTYDLLQASKGEPWMAMVSLQWGPSFLGPRCPHCLIKETDLLSDKLTEVCPILVGGNEGKHIKAFANCL